VSYALKAPGPTRQGTVQIVEMGVGVTACAPLARNYARLMDAIDAQDTEAAVRSTASDLLQRKVQVELPGRDTAFRVPRLVGAIETSPAK
jgi:hypothetical protein